MEKSWLSNLWRCAVCALSVAVCGCSSGGKSSQAALQHTSTAPLALEQPFDYASLKVRNSCFVESVHFYDEYLKKKRGGEDAWVRVLQWGNDDGNLQKIGQGHAVAVCRLGAVLWMYDVNFGFVSLIVPVDRRNDVTDVGPEIFGKYPQFKPMFISYREDLMPSRPGNVPQFLSNNLNADVRDATKVASELGRYRISRVIGFSYNDPASGNPRIGAAALFAFGQRLCIYFPSKGTHLSRLYAGSLDDLLSAARIVRQVYPTASNVRWQEGGTWKQPLASATTSGKNPPLTAEPQPLRLIPVDVTIRAH